MNYAFFDSNGAVRLVLASDEDALPPEVEGLAQKPCPDGVTPDSHYFDGQDFVPIPDRPNEFATFNYVLRAWETDTAHMAVTIRRRRDALLAGCDWTQIPDVPGATQAKWAAYRQALRDLPQQPGFPTNVTWPEAPA